MLSIVAIETYEEKTLEGALIRLLEPLGGIGKFTAKDGTTLLKPNLVRAAKPGLAITTHPNILKILGRLILSIGGDPLVADSPGAGYEFNKERLEETYKEVGLLETGIPLNWDTSYALVSNPTGLLMRRFEIMNAVLKAGVIINVAKLKTHTLTTITGAVKNMFGVIPGRAKIGYHGRFQNGRDFAQMLLDLCTFISPRLSIMDAIVGMEGNGPNHGAPVSLGFIAASTDPIALDMVSAMLVGAEIEQVPHLKIALELGLIPKSIDEMDIRSDRPITDFKKKVLMPVTVRTRRGGVFSSVVLAVLRPWIRKLLTVRPIVVTKKCTACGVCIKTCPRRAIILVQRKGRQTAVIDDERCIRCYCCDEQCPCDAIYLKKPLLHRWVGLQGEADR